MAISKHILVLDDEAPIREILCEALTAADCRVTAVATFEEGVQVLKLDPPDLVITDLQLVDSDGFAVVEQVKATNAAIPVIMLTGVLMDPGEIPHEIARSIASYVPKTASLDQIVREVRQCIG